MSSEWCSDWGVMRSYVSNPEAGNRAWFVWNVPASMTLTGSCDIARWRECADGTHEVEWYVGNSNMTGYEWVQGESDRGLTARGIWELRRRTIDALLEVTRNKLWDKGQVCYRSELVRGILETLNEEV